MRTLLQRISDGKGLAWEIPIISDRGNRFLSRRKALINIWKIKLGGGIPLPQNYSKNIGHAFNFFQGRTRVMAFTKVRMILLGAVVLLPACSFDDDSFWPSLTGDDPAGPKPQVTAQNAPKQAPASAAPVTRRRAPMQTAAAAQPITASSAPRMAAAPQPQLGTGQFKPQPVSQAKATGTFVGKKVAELRSELQRLQGSVSKHNMGLQKLRSGMVQNSQRYHGTVAAINARLQVGTTRGNPILIQQFNNAQTDLNRISKDIAAMNKLATSISSDSTMSQFLSESTHAAFGVSGAVDEDHRQLAILEDEVNRTVVLIERLTKEVGDDIRRQSNYVATERSNINVLSTGIRNGEIFGASLANRAGVSGAALNGSPARAASTSGRRPLVVIRFDRSNVKYQQAVYNAVSQVLERRPNAVFDLVAVSPNRGGPAKTALNANKSRRHAEGVLRSLVEMGLPPNRVALSGKTSAGAKTNEVHIYMR
jgi:hypothetical protein